jgi:hypothetical protein
MKYIILSLYLTSAFIIGVALLGGSLTKPMIEGASAISVKAIGISKANIDTMDVLIDNSIYNMNLMMYKIEKYKNTLLLKEDNSKPIDFKNYRYINNSVYIPIINSVSYLLRIILTLTAISIFVMTALLHTITSYFSLRRRVAILEQKLLEQKQ